MMVKKKKKLSINAVSLLLLLVGAFLLRGAFVGASEIVGIILIVLSWAVIFWRYAIYEVLSK